MSLGEDICQALGLDAAQVQRIVIDIDAREGDYAAVTVHLRPVLALGAIITDVAHYKLVPDDDA